MKDQKPYLIYACIKCQQYSYVKTTQKTATCLRCGRSHKVSKILNNGIIVKGMTSAMNYVKQKQNELAIKFSEFKLDLCSESDFRPVQYSKILSKNLSKTKKKSKKPSKHKDLFKNLLLQLFTMFKQFPKYMIELMAEDYKIPPSEVIILIKRFEKKEILVPLKDNYFTVRKIR